ncbi:hypothetical protein HOC01_05790 [archaeon]|jgi:hypothetical protein|nr:hypothetical protein [archaeon]MBT6697647.1 hypothetical protein [archaeon]
MVRSKFGVSRMFLLIGTLAMLLMLSSCTQISAGENPDQSANSLAAAQTGSRGVEVSFVSGFPQSTIYDISDFVAILEVYNKGNHDLVASDCYLQITGFDPNIIRGIDYVQSCGQVDGKSVYNLDGGWNQVEYMSTSITIPEGSYEYEPSLNLVWCYAYETQASASICVDPLFYQVTSEQKACEPRDVSMGGGQGGPVGVSYVGVDMVGDVAIFEITVRNLGSGRVLSPLTDISNCGSSTLEYSDLDIVHFTADMTGGNLIDCTPSDGKIRLSNDVGKAVCKFRITGTSAYETPLQIELDYNYIENTKKSVQIIETP